MYYVFSPNKAIFPTANLPPQRWGWVSLPHMFHLTCAGLGWNCLLTCLCICLALSTSQWLIFQLLYFICSDTYIFTPPTCLIINDVLSLLLIWGHDCHWNSYLCWAVEYNLILGKHLFIIWGKPTILYVLAKPFLYGLTPPMVGPPTAAWSSPGPLLEMHTLGLHAWPTKSESSFERDLTTWAP